ncbi:MAG TPA: dihydrofolate reductase family protein [Fimbriimonadaceae bacterium]|nr:dihydrofolate reductase family protein [Fimbriimonadaceae bacterium]
MGLVIPVAHDFTCPWCWIGLNQMNRLRSLYGVEFEWLAYELAPAGLDMPRGAPEERDPRRPYVPSRIALAYAAEGIEPPTSRRTGHTDTHAAHEAVEYAKTEDPHTRLPDLLYDAYWLHGRDISDIEVLTEVGREAGVDIAGMRRAIEERQFADKIVPFDEPAYDSGVFYVPTFFIGDEKYPEQTFIVVEKAVREALGQIAPAPLYQDLELPKAPEGRPYVYINMVSTIDGKTVTGARDEPVQDLGSELDHATMRGIEDMSDAVLVGAGSLRATRHMWYGENLIRIVATASGDLPLQSRFFTDAPERALVAVAAKNAHKVGLNAIVCGEDEIDWHVLLKKLRSEHGVQRLLVEGGSEINASLLAHDVVDELFLTIAPKIKLGRQLPTYAGGNPLPREDIKGFTLVSNVARGDEVFLRYRRNR